MTLMVALGGSDFRRTIFGTPRQLHLNQPFIRTTNTPFTTLNVTCTINPS